VLPGTRVTAEAFWQGLSDLLRDLVPVNRALLAKRDQIQAQIDAWHRKHPGAAFDAAAYRRLLTEIGYLIPEGTAFQVETANVDAEIAHIAGPQLVVPVDNARYALNAANARWGSLYDALYGTDAISEGLPVPTGGYDPTRGAGVIAYVRTFLDEHFPQAGHQGLTIEHLDDTTIRVRFAAHARHLRPGGTISGPTLMWLVDLSFYLLIMGRLGPVAQAVTTNLNINFMRKPEPADLLGEGRLMKLGRALAVGDFTIWSDGKKNPVAHATVTYSIPPAPVSSGG